MKPELLYAGVGITFYTKSVDQSVCLILTTDIQKAEWRQPVWTEGGNFEFELGSYLKF